MSKEKSIGELLEEARKKSGAPKLAGHDIMDLERFAPDTRHMSVFDVLTDDSLIGWKEEKTLTFLTDQGYPAGRRKMSCGTGTPSWSAKNLIWRWRTPC